MQSTFVNERLTNYICYKLVFKFQNINRIFNCEVITHEHDISLAYTIEQLNNIRYRKWIMVRYSSM